MALSSFNGSGQRFQYVPQLYRFRSERIPIGRDIEGNVLMEKRTRTRNPILMPVACSRLTTGSPAPVANGIMLNCSCAGTCIGLHRSIKKGSIVMIKATENFTRETHRELPEGFRSIALAEVKWSKPLEDKQLCNYAIGLKYLSN